MEIAITKMSPNGQVVIPSEIRKDARVDPSTKFIIFNRGGDILMKPVKKADFLKYFQLFEKISRSEAQILKKKYVRANTSMSEKELDALLRK